MNFKKTILSLLFSAELFISGCSNYSNIPELFFYSPKWEKISSNKPKDLMNIQLEVNYYIESIEDPPRKDIWHSPKKTIMLGEGDCDDIALYASYRAEQLGYYPFVLDLKKIDKQSKKKTYHWVSLIKHKQPDGKIEYGAIQQFSFLFEDYFSEEKQTKIFKGYDSINELINEINKKGLCIYTHYKIRDLNKLRKNWRTTNKNLWNYWLAYDLGYKRVKPINKTKN